MLELLLCSMVTVLPDYLFRRYAQGKRFGREINLFSIWYELRYGITGCLMLTIMLVTVIFYNHPATERATLYFRSIPLLAEKRGHVAEVFVGLRDEVKAGQPIFRMDSREQEADVATAKRKIEEIEAKMVVAQSRLDGAEGRLREAIGSRLQAQEELDTKLALLERKSNVVSAREIENLQTVVMTREGAVEAATAAVEEARSTLETLLPAQKAKAQAELDEALVKLDQTVIRAGVDGRVEQFTLRVGDFVSPLMRPAGVLVPNDSGRTIIGATFGQISAQVLKKGMLAEITCPALPLTVIPMVVTDVQTVITSGQLAASGTLVDTENNPPPSGVLALMEPLYEGALKDLPAGANCGANAYTNNHELLASGEVSGLRYLGLHAVDTLAIVHALLLRVHTLLLPIQTLVLSDH